LALAWPGFLRAELVSQRAGFRHSSSAARTEHDVAQPPCVYLILRHPRPRCHWARGFFPKSDPTRLVDNGPANTLPRLVFLGSLSNHVPPRSDTPSTRT